MALKLTNQYQKKIITKDSILFRALVIIFYIYTGCHKYVTVDQRLNFRANRGYNLKRSKARCAKIKELDLATLGTQTASIFTLRFAKNA